jgi:alpha 1,3-glucosidase
MSISGLGFVGADIGGFENSPDEELLKKWHWLGLFYPFIRQHAHLKSQKREPYLYEGDTFKQIKKTLELRQ